MRAEACTSNPAALMLTPLNYLFPLPDEVPFWVRDAQQLHKQYPPGSRER